MKKLFVLFAATALLSSCGQLNEKAGKAFCACMERPVQMDAEERENPGTYSQEEMDEAMASMDRCLEKVKEQYKDLVDEKGVKKGIKDNCPDTYKAMYPNE